MLHKRDGCGTSARPQIQILPGTLNLTVPIQLDSHDAALVAVVRTAIRTAVAEANMPSAVAKRITSEAVRHRNRGRAAAIKRHPFQGFCEASGLRLSDSDKVLDELEPEKGYAGKLRWVCPKANNSGKRTCGGC
jgi:hypothetical protein